MQEEFSTVKTMIKQNQRNEQHNTFDYEIKQILRTMSIVIVK